ncbi:hypothetical protein T439DRAFT_329393 [Meredithblackwellia eburnea MCA 4105]
MSIAASEELDDLLISYFELLDRYSTLQSILHDTLKQAHFQLAKAKLALGPTRLGENGWDLRHLKAGWLVDLKDSEAEQVTAISLTPAPPEPEEEKCPSQPSQSTSTLRNRSSTKTATSPSISSTEKASDDKELIHQKPKGPKDPLHQFSAFPPPSLRASQAEFKKASKTVCEVLELRERMRVLEERIQVVKGGVDVAK